VDRKQHTALPFVRQRHSKDIRVQCDEMWLVSGKLLLGVHEIRVWM
jgi:hypothetical protein